HETLRNAVLKTMAPHIAPPSGPPSLKVKPGKMVLEFLPFLDWDKGKAITHLFERPEFGAQGCMPLFIGDDVTDEDGFRDVNRLGGISLLVHDPLRDDPTRASLAQRRLADCDQVTAVLQALIRLLKAPIDQQPTSQPSQPRGSDSPEAAGS
ncbi:MAG: trehalose-phosphatase, partial [Rhodospirillaceae bacterium]